MPRGLAAHEACARRPRLLVDDADGHAAGVGLDSRLLGLLTAPLDPGEAATVLEVPDHLVERRERHSAGALKLPRALEKPPVKFLELGCQRLRDAGRRKRAPRA